jgi:hypothetical protein
MGLWGCSFFAVEQPVFKSYQGTGFCLENLAGEKIGARARSESGESIIVNSPPSSRPSPPGEGETFAAALAGGTTGCNGRIPSPSSRSRDIIPRNILLFARGKRF